MSAPANLKEVRDWLQGEIIKLSEAGNAAHARGEMPYHQIVAVHAENVAMATAKALNRVLELLEEKDK